MDYDPNSSSSEMRFFTNCTINLDPNAKNYSNCDILGSFYEIGVAKDVSGASVAVSSTATASTATATATASTGTTTTSSTATATASATSETTVLPAKR